MKALGIVFSAREEGNCLKCVKYCLPRFREYEFESKGLTIDYIDRLGIIVNKKEKNPLEKLFSNCGGDLNISITPEGDIYSCLYSISLPEFKIGNIRDNPIKEIWINPKLNFSENSVIEKLKMEFVKGVPD